MASNKQQQEKRNLGQVRDELTESAASAEQQGETEADRRVVAASREQDSETEDSFEA
ncbi:hypothetical protein [Paenibacillus ginsengarvi]|uniref:hypothetical protein n=1 Tax=Paenibacillus ginsengarvi TaxID=400777 RepID=UPI0013156FF1|nr:hypothetical protein [Paenibacillus ginsengarvi]